MKRRKIIKRLLWTLLIIFLFMNIIAYIHAYKFTHYQISDTPKTTSSTKLSITQKLGIAFFGISNPRPKTGTTPKLKFETISINSNRTIECWLIPVDSSKGTVILFHGYGGEKSSMLDKAYIFHDLGYNTMLVDFMGSGGSEGNETSIGFMEAEQVSSCVKYLNDAGESNITLFGTSLGAAAIMKSLHDEKRKVKSIIIECPFGTMLKTVKNRFSNIGVPSFPMAHLLVFWGGVQGGFNAFKHNPENYARKITCPTLLMYGEKDPKVTKEETDAIFKNLAGPKKLITFPEAGHENYLIKYRSRWINELKQFLE